jgi:hypothetical protein
VKKYSDINEVMRSRKARFDRGRKYTSKLPESMCPMTITYGQIP